VELNWSTFLLEIVNFLVLVWILKRLIYRPVLEVIARRKAGIEQALKEARSLKAEAEAMGQRYEGRLTDWEREREGAREALAKELEAERGRRLAALKADLEQQREKALVAEERRQAEALRDMEGRALAQGAAFASRLLAQATGPELEARLLELAVSELRKLPEARLADLRNRWGERPEAIAVASAHPLSDTQRQTLGESLAAVTGRALPLTFQQDPELLAGLRITLGAWVLEANLQAELRGFTDLAHGE
jgi:F-type H+-transporting ATPase subunit b